MTVRSRTRKKKEVGLASSIHGKPRGKHIPFNKGTGILPDYERGIECINCDLTSPL